MKFKNKWRVCISSIPDGLLFKLFLLCAGLFLSSSIIQAVHVGSSYEIREKDLLEVIMQKARTFKPDPDEMEKKMRAFVPGDHIRLPRAETERVFFPDMTYELEFDVPDQHGNILYPKGFKYDASQYFRLKNPVIIFNPTDEEQLAWFNRNWKDKIGPQVIITEGSFIEIGEKLLRPVFYLPEKLVSRMQLKRVPSVISQSDDGIQVKEIDVRKNN